MIKNLIILALASYSLQIDHCLSETKVCDSCKTNFNFLIDDSLCHDIAVAYCDTMSSDSKKCETCQTGYEINDEKTQCNKKQTETTIPNCATETKPGEDTFCSLCNKDYFPSLDQKSCVKNANCKEEDTSDPAKCLKCNDYYYPNSKGQCEKSFCDKKDNDGNCESCYDQFYLDDNDNCVKIPIAYCKSGDDEECEACMPGYTLSADKKSCKKDTQSEISLCATTEQENSENCESCFTGYTLNAQKKCIDNCAHYTSTSCNLCEDNYISYDGVKCEYIGSKSNSNLISFSLSLLSLILFFIM